MFVTFCVTLRYNRQTTITMDGYISTRLEKADKERFETLAGENQRTPSDMLRLLILKAIKDQIEL